MVSSARRVAFKLLTHGHRLLQLLVPPGRKRVVFTSIPDYADSSFATYRHLLTSRSGWHITWLVVDMSVRSRIEREFTAFSAERRGHRLEVLSRHSWRGYVAYLRAAAVFHTHGVFAFARTSHRRHIVSMWHGMTIKAVGKLNTTNPPRHLPYGTTHLATSEMFRYIMAAAFEADPGDVVVTTLPRTDSLVAPDPSGPSGREIRTRLGLDPERPTILWMPTYRTAVAERFVIAGGRPPYRPANARTFLDDLPATFLEELDDLCRHAGCQVLVKLHPMDALNHRAHDLRTENIRLITSDEFLAAEVELYDVLGHCSALMSDVSSVVIDFIPTEKPIGLVAMPGDDYERNLVLPLHLFTQSSRFHHVDDPEVLRAFVAAAADGYRHAADSFTDLLHPVHRQSGCEAVLRAAGV